MTRAKKKVRKPKPMVGRVHFMILSPKDLPNAFKDTFYLSVNYGTSQNARDIIEHLTQYIAWAESKERSQSLIKR
jgi:hypothetical protein